MEYKISKKEISRRLSAFQSLLIGILLGFFMLGILVCDRFMFLLFGVGVFLVVSVVALIVTRIYFKRYLETKILLSTGSIERIGLDNHQKMDFSEIEKLVVKKKTDHLMREIRVIGKQEMLVFDGLENMDQLGRELERRFKGEVKVIKEPMDFDSPIFYPVLGLIIGGVSAGLFDYLLNFPEAHFVYLKWILVCYLFCMGMFFFLARPIYKRRGKDSRFADAIFGIILMLGGLLAMFIDKI